ncbi:Ig family protein [Fibrella aestuarina BUZ 2]|uniref:Ig family protein n=1 Tax=Fibrella aestuarina BUZ 2 TaxID=1166018 RepID=I0KD10_9BACT|nr:putative Ig domain-containing protein [Fibrella aestuarina]CCH02013.1 Ig family protein [Fibrella aestuarina BUZ 2]
MPTRLLQVANRNDKNARFPKGVPFDYPVDAALTQAQAEAAFASDQARDSKLESPRRAARANMYWKLVAPPAAKPTRFLGRNPASPGVLGSVSLYWEAAAGLTGWKTRLVAIGAGAQPLPDVLRGLTAPLVYDAAGYTRTNLIDDTLRCHYASLHLNVPSQTYRIEWLDASGVVQYATEQIITDTGPNIALPDSGTSGNQAPTVASPASDVSAYLGIAFSTTLPTNQFVDPDGSIASVTLSALPPGLSYSPSSRTITGTPTQVGTYIVTATGTDNQNASITDQFVITVLSQTNTNPGWTPGTPDTPMTEVADYLGNAIENTPVPVNP